MDKKVSIYDNRKISRVVIFVAIVAAWIAADVLTKQVILQYASSVGKIISGPILGLFNITLAYNTGGAWSMFSDSTMVLAVFSLIVCIVLTICCFTLFRRNSILVLIGIALVVGGGIGNCIDRFMYGYVIDFIETTFITFPIFNIADIGVTCGFVLFLIGYIRDTLRESKTKNVESDE